jgi:hypothetical protein
MSTRLQISDKNNNLLTVQLASNVFSQGGTWMPDYPGKVRSDPDWQSNPWNSSISDDKGSFEDAVCYTLDGTGVRILVMRFNGAFQNLGGAGPLRIHSYNVLKAGSGYLYQTGNLTMAEGVFTWTNLDAVLADSADDSSDSDSDGSDDSSDVSDSAYA